MKREEIRVCVLRAAGTNCDAETRRSFEALGVHAEVAHVNDIVKKGSLLEYSAMVIPGGFAYGDYVRAGAILAKWVLVKFGGQLKTFVEEGRPVLGICNGFQVLVEAGLLPGFEGMSQHPEATLATNLPPGYNCRWINLKHENLGRCVFTRKIPKAKVLHVPVAHSEGRFLFPKEKEKRCLEKLCENDQLVFRYCSEEGDYARGEFPMNPNGSYQDIAGICNSEGTVFGLMPHPERAFYWWQQPDWTRRQKTVEYGDGKLIFESLITYLVKKN